ncbi:hypothetical protein COO60DRAFT_1556242 [Scenedesmus sp. NREL 46B-D3]|nr:hypothetical protein COO60DRAFT_1556242 [Scenedesmus sp. NREL 46B-D3]
MLCLVAGSGYHAGALRAEQSQQQRLCILPLTLAIATPGSGAVLCLYGAVSSGSSTLGRCVYLGSMHMRCWLLSHVQPLMFRSLSQTHHHASSSSAAV